MLICQRCRRLDRTQPPADWVTLGVCPDCLNPNEQAEIGETTRIPDLGNVSPESQVPPEPPPERL